MFCFMKTNRNTRTGEREEGLNLIKGLLVSLITAGLFLLLLAAIITLKDMNPTGIQIAVSAIVCVASFIGGLVAGSINRKNGMKIGALTGAFLAGMFLLAGVICNGIEFTYFTPIKFLTGVLPAAIGGVIGVNKVAKRKI